MSTGIRSTRSGNKRALALLVIVLGAGVSVGHAQAPGKTYRIGILTSAWVPVELPTEIEFVVNLKTAERIGLRVQPHVLLRANRVIQ